MAVSLFCAIFLAEFRVVLVVSILLCKQVAAPISEQEIREERAKLAEDQRPIGDGHRPLSHDIHGP